MRVLLAASLALAALAGCRSSGGVPSGDVSYPAPERWWR